MLEPALALSGALYDRDLARKVVAFDNNPMDAEAEASGSAGASLLKVKTRVPVTPKGWTNPSRWSAHFLKLNPCVH